MSLTDITKYFDQNWKKRDLSDNSNQEKSAKKLKEGSLNTCRARYRKANNTNLWKKERNEGRAD